MESRQFRGYPTYFYVFKGLHKIFYVIQDIHFILEYPESIIDILNQSHSDVLIAEKPSDYNTKYQVTFIEEIELTEAELAKIEDNISGFNLLIADSEKDIIAQFIDLYGYNQYDAEKSNNTYLD
ncbi:hypothetical protein E2L07_17385 [Halalkalibacterium halodurans]|uniref:hypothetical protein n=1 Tax=Halalkalibacterium halodurans TaxID=86665 RepID=UPI0010675BCA|nr:hypothetical protein [Halalkalibacterium halodurans]TES49030.1 hypothetical protein E2L07_17385 [Halalkalibacterium halodurans]